VVGRVERLERELPVAAIDQVVPVRDDVVDRAAALAERDAAVHAARPLLRRLVVGQVQDELAVVPHARLRVFGGLLEALELEESGDFAHVAASFAVCLNARGVAATPSSCAASAAPAAWRGSRRARACTRSGTP